RTKTNTLILWSFPCAKDRCVIGPRRWHDDTRTDVRSRVSAHVHCRTASSSVYVVVHRACYSAYPLFCHARCHEWHPIARERQKNERFPGATLHPSFLQPLTTRKLVR